MRTKLLSQTPNTNKIFTCKDKVIHEIKIIAMIYSVTLQTSKTHHKNLDMTFKLNHTDNTSPTIQTPTLYFYIDSMGNKATKP